MHNYTFVHQPFNICHYSILLALLKYYDVFWGTLFHLRVLTTRSHK